MIVTANIKHSTGEVLATGGAPFVFDGRIGDTIILSLAFLGDKPEIIPLADGATGRLILKPLDGFLTGPRWKIDAWTVTGSGANRRYHFKAVLDSDPLRNDLLNNPFKAYALQVEYAVNGDPFRTRDVSASVANSYFQASDVAPQLPIGGPESVEFENEVWGLNENVINGERWAGNVNRGGDIHSVRLSVREWHEGLEVQVKVNGADLFASPVAITGQTQVWKIDDEPLLLDMTSIPDGAKIDVLTTFSGLDYGEACKGLQLELSMRTKSTIELEGWDWLKDRLPTARGFTHHNTPREIGLSGGGGGGGTSIIISGGYAMATIDGVTYKWPAIVVSD